MRVSRSIGATYAGCGDDRQVARWLAPPLRFIGAELGFGLHG
jgi:hypothetical protein